jgi:glyoxylase-like metal-dependent hydrolase (beta-lactamase superfamily II)
VTGTPYLRMIRAANPGPMTLEGTNTWLVGDPDGGPVVVVDPGPLLDEHLEAIVAAAPSGIAAVLLTHRHLDHSEAAAALAERAGCGVRAADPEFRVGAAGLEDGDRLEVTGASLTLLATPGHTSDSVSALLQGEDGAVRLLSGDMVLGQGTTVITHPDGDLGAYLDSLARMQRLVAEREVIEILPGHGPVVTAPGSWLAYYREHRLERLDQVRAALAAGARTPAEVVAQVYAEVDRRLWPAAEQSVRAQLAYLAAPSKGDDPPEPPKDREPSKRDDPLEPR